MFCLFIDRGEPTTADQTERSQHHDKAHPDFELSEKDISLKSHESQ
jgi:hypothetical protein